MPAGGLPRDYHVYPCQVSVTTWRRVDRLFGSSTVLVLQLQLHHVWTDGPRDPFTAEYDPYEGSRWPIQAFDTGLAPLASLPTDLVRLKVWGCLKAPHSAVFVDDFYAAIHSIIKGYGKVR